MKIKKIIITFSVVLLILLAGIIIPKIFISDISGVSDLESDFIAMDARMFFDNPFEILFIMKTAITEMNEEEVTVTAYSFFGLKYRSTDIPRSSDYEMALLLRRDLPKENIQISDIIEKIKYPKEWKRYSYQSLVTHNQFGYDKLSGKVPGINSDNSIFLKTDYLNNDVYLITYLEEINRNSFRENDFDDIKTDSNSKYIIQSNNIKILDEQCPGTWDCYRLNIGDKNFLIVFEVVSNQEFPEGLEGAGWIPDNNIRKVDILNILRSIAGMPTLEDKKYFNEDLKIYFSYPGNFYMENESLGPNHDIVIIPLAPGDPRRNPQANIASSLRMKKVSKGEEFDELLDDYQKKSEDKTFYPDFSQEDIEINGRTATLIKYNDVFSGGMITNVLLDFDDFILRISYFEGIPFTKEFEQIINDIAAPQSICEELEFKFKAVAGNADVRLQESSLWWNDENGYSIHVPGTESIIASKNDEVMDADFLKNNFSRDLLKIAKQVLTERGFTLNKQNSSIDESDKRFYDYVQAYENGKDLCVVRANPDYVSNGCFEDMFMCRTVNVSCGNDLAGSQAEQLPFLKALDLRNKETVATIISQDEPFYQISMHGRRAGSAAVLKKEGDSFRVIFIGQEGPPCEILDKEKIPATVLTSIGKGSCFTETGYREAN